MTINGLIVPDYINYMSIHAAASVLAPVLSGVSRLLPHAAYQRTGVLDLLCIVASSLQRSLAGIPALR